MNATHIVLITLLIVVTIVVTLYIRKISKLRFFKTRTTEAEKVIEEELKLRHDLIKETKPFIQKNTKMDIDFYDELEKMTSSNINTIELEKELTKAIVTINMITDDYPKLLNKKDYKEILRKLSESTTKLDAAKQFYNNNNNRLSELLKTFPSNIIGKIKGYESTPNYDAKQIFNAIEEDIRL